METKIDSLEDIDAICGTDLSKPRRFAKKVNSMIKELNSLDIVMTSRKYDYEHNFYMGISTEIRDLQIIINAKRRSLNLLILKRAIKKYNYIIVAKVVVLLNKGELSAEVAQEWAKILIKFKFKKLKSKQILIDYFILEKYESGMNLDEIADLSWNVFRNSYNALNIGNMLGKILKRPEIIKQEIAQKIRDFGIIQ